MGYEVICCHDGQEALLVIKDIYREINIILMDFVMPNMDGLTALSHLKKDKKTRFIPVIIMSADILRSI